jgi:cytochrome c oxidase subunit IV
MSENTQGNPYRVYWITWATLLAITVMMLLAEKFHMPPWSLILFLVAFMMVKATMISGTFMHLRFEKGNLALMVGCGILVTSMILLAYITPEAWNVLQKSGGR